MSLPLLPASLWPLAVPFVRAAVSIGGLADAPRRLVLGRVWAGLPDAPMSERDVNQALNAKLAGVVNFLDIDHVELRRWLVDAGWLARVGFGREYQRAAGAALPTTLQPLAAAFEGVDTDKIAAATRAVHSAEREARRSAWAERKGASS
jgi:hypothetical protein